MGLPNYIIVDPDVFDFEDNLGYYAFDVMTGSFMNKQQQYEITRRRGHPGETLRETGVWAEPSRIRTMLGCTDRTEAIARLEDYVGLKTMAPYEFIQLNESYGFFRVVDVKMAQPIPLGSQCGFLNPAATIAVYYDWTIISTVPPDPGP